MAIVQFSAKRGTMVDPLTLASAGGSIIGGIAGLFGARKRRRAQEAARREAIGFAEQGSNYLRDAFGGFVEQGQGAGAAQAGLLGLGDPAAGQQGFQNYLDSTGYQFELGEGVNAINSSAAARGAINSGATLKALQRYGQGLAGQRFDNYLNQLNVLANRGFVAGGAVGNSFGQTAAIAAGQPAPQRGAGMASFFGGLGGALGELGSYFNQPRMPANTNIGSITTAPVTKLAPFQTPSLPGVVR